MSCSERLVKLVEFWQGLENARPARPAGASVIEQLAKKSIGVSFLLLATFAPSDSSTVARNIRAQMSFEATTEVIKVSQVNPVGCGIENMWVRLVFMWVKPVFLWATKFCEK